jgi:hypothetical protein
MCGAMFMFPLMGGQPGMPTPVPGQMAGGMGGMPHPGMHPGAAYGQPGQGYPPPGYGAPGYPPQGMPGPGMPGQPGFGGDGGFGGFGARNIGDRFAGLDVGAPQQAEEPQFAQPEPEAPPEPRNFKIICPNGHEVPTPEDMFGMQALCPFCNAQMDLKYEASVEYRQQQELQQRIRDDQTNKFWMKASIFGAIIVGLLLVGMVAMIFM